MNGKPLVLIGLACILIAGVSGIAAAEIEYTQVDENHPLNNTEKVSIYQNTGQVEGDFIHPQMTVKIAEDRTDVGLSTNVINSVADSNNQYIRIDYNEDKDRIVRFYIKDEYFEPYSDELSPIKGGEIAEIKPVRDRNYTSVKVRLNGNQSTYIYQISKSEGFVSQKSNQISETRDSFIESANPFSNTTEEEKPNPSEVEWQYISTNEINTSNEIPVGNIEEGYQIQYYNSENKEWVSVPETEQSDRPYYIQTRQDVNDSVWVISTQNATPQIRYKTSGTLSGEVKETGQGIGDIIDSILKDIQSIF